MNFEKAKALALLGHKIRRSSWYNQAEYVTYFGPPFNGFIKFMDYVHFIPFISAYLDTVAFDWEEFQ